jgi:hypothetical protein
MMMLNTLPGPFFPLNVLISVFYVTRPKILNSFSNVVSDPNGLQSRLATDAGERFAACRAFSLEPIGVGGRPNDFF